MISSFMAPSASERAAADIQSAFISSLTSAAAVVKLTDVPFWQAASLWPKAMWVLPALLGQRAITF
jgi:hypothetical protein